MNLLQLVIKQMRQRALSTWLTLLSVVLGVSLADSIMIMRRESQNLFAQTDYGYDILIGPPKGSPLQLTLNTVYHMDTSPGVIPFGIYADMIHDGPPLPGHPDYRMYLKTAIPFLVGDSFKGRRIVGTSPQMFGYDDAGSQQPEADRFQYRKDKSYELAEGRVFAPRKFEAVIGADLARELHLHVYDPSKSDEENEQSGGAFRATHGMPAIGAKPDIHKPKWRIVGILKPTHTANDRVLFVPFVSLFAIAEHESGMIDQALMKANINPQRVPAERLNEVLEKLGIDPQQIPDSVRAKFKMHLPTTGPAKAQPVGELMTDIAATTAPAATEEAEDPDVYHLDEQGNIVPDLPPDEWELSAILVRSRGFGYQASMLMYNFKVIDDRATAINPASVMRDFFQTFLAGSTTVLLLISAFVTVVAAASIMTTIYNSVSARLREIAILRALGATRMRILALICTEAIAIGLFGGLMGMLVGHLLSGFGSIYLAQMLGEGINWVAVSSEEWLYLLAVVVLSALAGLVPALKAYKTPVATHLVAG